MEKTMEAESETREAKFCLYAFYECECLLVVVQTEPNSRQSLSWLKLGGDIRIVGLGQPRLVGFYSLTLPPSDGIYYSILARIEILEIIIFPVYNNYNDNNNKCEA